MAEPVRISIPDRPQGNVEQQAGQIVLDALREAGMNPLKLMVITHPMVRALVGAWGRGECTRAQFVNGCRNLTILNPALK